MHNKKRVIDMETIYNNLYTKDERKKLTAEGIKTLRQSKNLQQKEVADAIGIALTTYQTYETGRTETPIEILVRLSFLYDVPIDIIVQRNNLSKNNDTTRQLLSMYENQLAQLREQIKTADPVTQAKLHKLIESIEEMCKKINTAL